MKFFRLLNPYRLSPPVPSVLHVLRAIGDTFDRVIMIIVMILIVMVTAALLSNVLFSDSLQYRCTPFQNQTDKTYAKEVYDDDYFQTYGVQYFTSIYNDRYCGKLACSTGFNCTNIGIPFAGGIADFSEPGVAFLANLTFITMRGWGDIFFALVDANGAPLCFLMLLLCILVVSEVYVNMISAILANNMRCVETGAIKAMILQRFPGTKEMATELERLVWAFNSGIFVETKVEEDKVLSKGIKAINEYIFSHNESADVEEEQDGHNNEDEKEKEKGSRRKKKGKLFLIKNVDVDDKKPACIPNCYGCDKLRDLLASDGGPLSMIVIIFVLMDTFVLAFDSTSPDAEVLITMEVVNYAATAIFLVDIVLRISVMGPCLFFDSSFNILDFTLVFLNIVTLVSGVAGFVSNFRVLRLFRLMRLYKIAYLVQIQEGQAVSDASLGFVRFLSLLTDLSKPILQYTTLLVTALFVMAVIGMHVFGNAASTLQPYNASYKGLTPLTLMWNGYFTERMTFKDFPTAFITLFNMSCLDGWYPVMWTFINSNGMQSVLFFVAWIITSNWLLQGLLTALIMMYMEKLAREFILCKSIGNKIVVHNIVRIKDNQLKVLAFNMMKDFVEQAEGVSSEAKKHDKHIKEEAEPDPRLTWLQAFFAERKNYNM